MTKGQRDKLKILQRDRTASQNLGWDMGGDRVLILCHGTGWAGILTPCPVPEKTGTTAGQKRKKSKKKIEKKNILRLSLSDKGKSMKMKR